MLLVAQEASAESADGFFPAYQGRIQGQPKGVGLSKLNGFLREEEGGGIKHKGASAVGW